MDFPLVQETEVMGEVDIDRLVVATAEGMSADQQRELVGQAALVFNELLNVIPLWERYGNNAVLEGVRVQPWPADDAPIMKNSFYADGIVTILILDGTLKPVE
jgi:peptide/nickel transport system substrate-binding protein